MSDCLPVRLPKNGTAILHGNLVRMTTGTYIHQQSSSQQNSCASGTVRKPWEGLTHQSPTLSKGLQFSLRL